MPEYTFYNWDIVKEPLPGQERQSYSESVRGDVTEFSDKSRRRLAFVASNTGVAFEKMVTLTYGERYPDNGMEVKRNLKAFLQWVRRNYGAFQYLWFLEFQARGAPHVHILLDVKEYMPYGDVAKAWCKIVNGDESVLDASTRTEALRHKDGRYAVKYAQKMRQKVVPKAFSDVGRLWGHSRGVKPVPIVTIDMVEEDLVAMTGNDRHVLNAVVAGYSVIYGAHEKMRVLSK